MGKRVIGIENYRLFVLANRTLNSGPRVLNHQVPTSQICFVGLGIYCGNHPGCCLDVEPQMFTKRPNDGRRNLVLHREDIRKFPVIGLRPKMKAVAGVDKLGSDAYLNARLADAAFQNEGHIQLLADIDDIPVLALELKR